MRVRVVTERGLHDHLAAVDLPVLGIGDVDSNATWSPKSKNPPLTGAATDTVGAVLPTVR